MYQNCAVLVSDIGELRVVARAVAAVRVTAAVFRLVDDRYFYNRFG